MPRFPWAQVCVKSKTAETQSAEDGSVRWFGKQARRDYCANGILSTAIFLRQQPQVSCLRRLVPCRDARFRGTAEGRRRPDEL